MVDEKLVILITGAIAKGKTTLLRHVYKETRRQWRACGFAAEGTDRTLGSGRRALVYDIELFGSSKRLPWAARNSTDSGLEFDDNSRIEIEKSVRADIEQQGAEICFLDDIGRLELRGGGFAGLFRYALNSSCPAIVAAVKKDFLDDVVKAFGLVNPVIVDLDKIDTTLAYRDIRKRISALDSERIGAFAGISGLVEVGIGSTLHAYNVPLKGHALAFLQNLLFIAFGKVLHGRGLLRIAFISAMLKAFSPVGAKFRPMLFIFLQGCAFSLPVRLFGWNIAAVLAGSVLMGWLNLSISLAMDYAIFGRSIFDAFASAVLAASTSLGVQSLSLKQIIGALFILKAALAIGLASFSFLIDLQPLMRRMGRRKRFKATASPRVRALSDNRSPLSMAIGALHDVARPRFALMFFTSALFMFFFADLSRAGLLTVVLRGLCISYLGFLLVRGIDIQAVGLWLDGKFHMGLDRSLPVALNLLASSRSDHDENR